MANHEDRLCIALTSYVLRQWPMLRNHWIHVPNEGKRTPQGGHKMKRMGMAPGASDYFVTWPSGDFSLLVLEVKTDKGQLSDSQKRFLIDQRRVPTTVAVVGYGWDDCKDIIDAWMDDRPDDIVWRQHCDTKALRRDYVKAQG